MNLPTVLDVAIGLVLVLFVLSSICSAIAEMLANLLQDRPEMLRRAVYILIVGERPDSAGRFARLMSRWDWGLWVMRRLRMKCPIWPANTWEPSVIQRFWRHPSIAPLTRPDRVAPSYLPGDAFATAAISIAMGPNAQAAGKLNDVIQVLEKNSTDPDMGVIATKLLGLARVSASYADPEPFMETVHRWYDQAQARTSGEYKRLVGFRLLWVGFLAAVALNVDVVRITYVLSIRPDVRETAAALSDSMVQKAKKADDGNAKPGNTENKSEKDKSRSGSSAAAADAKEATEKAKKTEMGGAGAAKATEKADPTFEDAQRALSTHMELVSQLEQVGFPIGWSGGWGESGLPATRDSFKKIPDKKDPAKEADTPAPSETGLMDQICGIFSLVKNNATPSWYWQKIAGFLAAGIAVTFGAPFWFEMLGKLVSLRSSGTRPKTLDAELEAAGAAVVATVGSGGTIGSIGAVPSAPIDLSDKNAEYRRSLGEAQDDLNAEFDGFDSRLAYWTALAAQAAYETPISKSETVAPPNCFSDTLKFQSVSFFNETAPAATWEGFKNTIKGLVKQFRFPDTQVYLCKSAGVTLVAFRGTEGDRPSDIVTDASFSLVDAALSPSPVPGARVHVGFQKAFDVIWPKLKPLLDGEVIFTGHSLGAALATLAAARVLVEKPNGATVKALYTFGSPRVGDSKFADWLNEALGKRCMRFVNDLDVVTRVPTRSMGFSHVGKPMFFDAYGRLHESAEAWQRFLNTMTQLVDDYRNAGAQTVQDHSMVKYLERCKSLVTDKPVRAT